MRESGKAGLGIRVSRCSRHDKDCVNLTVCTRHSLSRFEQAPWLRLWSCSGASGATDRDRAGSIRQASFQRSSLVPGGVLSVVSYLPSLSCQADGHDVQRRLHPANLKPGLGHAQLDTTSLAGYEGMLATPRKLGCIRSRSNAANSAPAALLPCWRTATYLISMTAQPSRTWRLGTVPWGADELQ